MSIHPSTPWHKASYDQFLSDRLPQLLAECLPLAGYRVIENARNGQGPLACTLQVELVGGVWAEFSAIPRPDEDGLFYLEGEPRLVIPLVSAQALDVASVACVGEQLYDYIQERLGRASHGVTWDEDLLRAWLPLDRWVNDFLREKAQRLDTTNWLSRHTHLRRILIPNREEVIAPEERGRVCPFETPEGPYIGRVFTVAVGAEIRAGRLVIVDERPEAGLGLCASMLPFLEHNDPNRLLMAANMMRQAIVPHRPEPAWVQTGLEPDAPDFWCGRNLLTAFVSWGPATSEDGILLSESAARRLNDPFPVEPGDKLSNRHGSKGVVSYILPDEQMPHLADGTPLELVYNFPGLRTRMHIGQVREALLGRIARCEGAPAVVPPFAAPAAQQLRSRLQQAGLPESGMEILTLGKGGPALERPSAVGWVYWNRLAHLAKDKIKVTPDELPGQFWKEAEFGILRGLGATHTLREAVNTRSSRRPDVGTLAQRLTRGSLDLAGAPSPMFAALAARLQVANIRAELHGERLSFRFALPERQGLTLARPQPHPWLHERQLEVVGALPAADAGDETGLPTAEYTRLVEANARLGRMLSSQVPERLVREAETRLQEALNALFTALLPPEMLHFEERQFFSGRAVAAPATGLPLDQAGIPEALCWKLFGPWLAAEMGDAGLARPGNPQALQALDELLARSWVIVHRAPAFASTALLAFHPVRDEHRVVRLNPLVCRWMNVDFDGDQVACYLPLTAATQGEAGALLSVAGQLGHNPSLLKTLLFPPEVVWGLAYRSLEAQGRQEIAALAGVAEDSLEQVLTQAGLSHLLSLSLEREGMPAMLARLERLAAYGYEAVQRSGASLNPFIGCQPKAIPAPEGDQLERWEAYSDELAEKILASSDYRDLNMGPQLLDARARSWNWRSLPMVVGVRGVVSDAAGKPFIVRHNYAEGLTPDEMYACVAGARQGFAQLNVQGEQMLQDAQKRGEGIGLSVLARARRARYPGIVFARAAANGEMDPLEEGDSRLMVGLD